MTNFCIDCKHSTKSEVNEDIYYCNACYTLDLVTGKESKHFCKIERMDSGKCGIFGGMFIEKHVIIKL